MGHVFDEMKLLLLLALGVCLSVQMGCRSYNHSVIAATGTSIGVEVSQNPATQVPQAKLGYQRAELAVVPTNRSAEKTTTAQNSMGDGAKDHGEVIMELRYGGIFDTGKSSGIYQRLAVGKTAVSQPGAAFMFAKDDEGELKGNTADAVVRAAEAAAFSDKLSSKRGLGTLSLLREVYSGLAKLGTKPPLGQDDSISRHTVKQLDDLIQYLPDKYEFNNYRESSANTVVTGPKKGSPSPKTRMTFDGVIDYHSELALSIQLIEGLLKRPRNSFAVDCPPRADSTPQPANCDNGIPDTATLQKELEEQRLHLKQFTDEWGKRETVLKAVDYYISSLKR